MLELALDCACAADPKLRLYGATLARLCLERDPESFPLKGGGDSIESRKKSSQKLFPKYSPKYFHEKFKVFITVTNILTQ